MKELFEAVDKSFESEQIPWLAAIVNQPSHTYARDDVEQAAQMLDHKAELLGLKIQRIADKSQKFADHRVYSTPSTKVDDRSLALVGHVDTVFPRSLGFLKFSRDLDSQGGVYGDVIRGPGVLDMKSGLSAMLFAIKAIRTVAPRQFQKMRLRMICVSDEEVGSPTSYVIYEQLAAKITGALVFEAGRTEDRIITRRKGGSLFTVTVQGKAAHAGNDHASGVSAIHVLSLLIPQIEALTDYQRGLTVNVGLVEGGTAKNTVPDQATATIDARFETKEDAKAFVEQLKSLAQQPFRGLHKTPKKLYQASVKVAGAISRMPMEATEKTQQLRKAYEVVAAKVGLGVGEAPLQGGGSDANLLAAHGVPCIDGLGPYGRHFHKVEEWSSLSSLRRRTQALAAFLLKNQGLEL